MNALCGSTAPNDSSNGETPRSTQQRRNASAAYDTLHAESRTVQTRDEVLAQKTPDKKSSTEEALIERGSGPYPPASRFVSEEDQLQAPPIRRLRFYKGKGDKGDFCTYTVTSFTPPAYPPIMEDGEPRQPAALFIHICPGSLDVHVWMWTSSQNWVPVSVGAVHPTMPYRCLYIKKGDGSVEVNWVLKTYLLQENILSIHDNKHQLCFWARTLAMSLLRTVEKHGNEPGENI